MFLGNPIQLGGDLRKIPVQIQGSNADLVAAHLVAIVRLDGLVCCRIKKYTGNRMRLIPKLCVLILYIGEDLIQIARVNGVNIELRLSCVGIVLGIDNQHLTPMKASQR